MKQLIGKPVKPDMIRTNHHLSDDHRYKLAAESARTGAPMAEIIRRALDKYFESHKDDPPSQYRIVATKNKDANRK